MTVFILSLTFLGRQSTTRLMPTEDAEHGILSLRIAVPDLPPDVWSFIVRLQRGVEEPIVDSIALRWVRADTAIRKFRLAPGEWLLTLRAQDQAGKSRYVGLAPVKMRANERIMGTIHVNAEAERGARPEILVSWGGHRGRWKMALNNPVVAADREGWDRDHYYVCDPAVLRIGGKYYMWYASGYNPFLTQSDSIWTASAVSSDGKLWNKRGPITLLGPLPRWTKRGFICRCVTWEDGRFQMWFTAITDSNDANAIGTAHSIDGIHWSVAARPIVLATKERPMVFAPSVVKINARLFLYFSVQRTYRQTSRFEILLLTSADGIRWVDEGSVLNGRQVVPWEEEGVCIPCVVIDGNHFNMYYSTSYQDSQGRASVIGFAESHDGKHWLRVNTEPFLSSEDTTPWSTKAVTHPAVLLEGSRVRTWFAGLSRNEERWQVGYAECARESSR